MAALVSLVLSQPIQLMCVLLSLVHISVGFALLFFFLCCYIYIGKFLHLVLVLFDLPLYTLH